MNLSNIILPNQLTIKAYRKKERIESQLIDTFKAAINPDSFLRTYAIKYQQTGGIGTTAQVANMGKTLPGKLQFSILIDGTHVLNSGLSNPISKKINVATEVEKFLKLCYETNGDSHSPNFLVLEWGGAKPFQCKLLNADVNYTLIDRSGQPLRAEIDVRFIEDISEEEESKLVGRKSPDITHAHLVKAGDTLPLIAKDIYGNASYYLKLARFNKIKHFRRLETGQEIELPPLAVLENQV